MCFWTTSQNAWLILPLKNSIGSFGKYIPKAFYICPNILSPSVFSRVEFQSRTCLYYKICSRIYIIRFLRNGTGILTLILRTNLAEALRHYTVNNVPMHLILGRVLFRYCWTRTSWYAGMLLHVWNKSSNFNNGILSMIFWGQHSYR